MEDNRGTSFTCNIVTVMVCESESSLSLTVMVNVSLPLKSKGALKLTSLPSSKAIISVPSVILKVSSSPSISDPDTLKLPEVSSSKDTSDTASSTGASLTGVIVNVTLAVSVNSPSLTVNVNESSPLVSGDGV